jgi:sigma-B regulation protein RsbU (phosphoserine phosphatase)
VRVLGGLSRQPPLGTMEDYPYRSDPLSLAAGEALFLFSDGVTEAEDPAGEPFGDERLAACLEIAGKGSAMEVVSAVQESLRDFCGATAPSDDVTVLAVRVLTIE